MSTKYEIIEIDQTEITVDVSLLIKTEDLFFNATEMARSFGKEVHNWLKQKQTKEYVESLIKFKPEFKSELDLINARRGKYGGTYLHKELALQFARWLSADFSVQLDQWVFTKLKEEQTRKRARLEARTGFLPMTNAIMEQHDPAKFYHFSTEADLLNRIVLGMSAKKFKEINVVDSVRDACTVAQVRELNDLQIVNTGLIKIGMDYADRKGHLERLHKDEIKQIEGN